MFNPECTKYVTGVKNPGDKIYARVNVPWSEPWEVENYFKAYTNPYKISFYNNLFISNESQNPYTAGQVVELSVNYYTGVGVTDDIPRVFTKP